MSQQPLTYCHTHRERYLQELFDFLRIPSISTLPEAAPDMQRAAQWLAEAMARIGLDQVAVMPTAGHPLVYGQWLDAGPQAPTLLFYGHYDVQPVDPLDEWLSPPFEPTVRNNQIFCRGASDDKGQVYLVLAAIDSYLRTEGRLPINLKVIIEGEEEISSPNLTPWVEEHREMLACDAVLICDTGILAENMPLINHGTRGLTYMEVEVQGPATDLHSGGFGGVVDNPFNVLVRILAQLQDGETRRVLIPGFYDQVAPPDALEERLLAQAPISDQVIQGLTGAPAAAGEAGYTAAERVTVRPTLDIHGMPGGFTGEGKKTVIPARASAKVSMRLVPNQDPAEIATLFERRVRSLAPSSVKVTVRTLGLARWSLVDLNEPAIQAAARAYETSFGTAPLFMRGGGTLPIVADFQDILKAPVVMMGFGLPNDNAHAPNEKLSLTLFQRGIETVIHYFTLLPQAMKAG
ncbi:MAG TPA: dipeptidase [Anaerolineae bacterium]|nr:dipeptidase [Anaerolineae bacterium]HNU04922.1 dipeptidase [Anaerolineae bacterium]